MPEPMKVGAYPFDEKLSPRWPCHHCALNKVDVTVSRWGEQAVVREFSLTPWA